ncbi:hypothetical protein ABZP36_015356 [Zizania latifolia]
MVTGSFSRSTSARLTARGGVGSPRVSARRRPRTASGGRHRGLRSSASPWPSSFPPSRSPTRCICMSSATLAAGRGRVVTEFAGENVQSCDVFDGSWVPDERYPLYNSSECPFAERGFNCLANGRKDTGYLKWRWKPRGCDVPLFSARDVLERLRGKRVVFVGDSMSRTQWESFICMLMAGVEDPKTVYEVNGNQISKTIRFWGVRFASFNLDVEFFRSVFLVQQSPAPRHGPKRVRSILKLDKMDNISRKWENVDVLIFNSGHWCTHSKLFDMGCYFEAGGVLKLGTSINSAFQMALKTWAWVKKKVDLKIKTNTCLLPYI